MNWTSKSLAKHATDAMVAGKITYREAVGVMTGRLYLDRACLYDERHRQIRLYPGRAARVAKEGER